ncbi:Bax inhibitor-1/YccA family protein [Brevibacillus humidisoli]|uniref:Bax inhibitor-1/YccA family protein n=1 Tax=Brevibacillus humidisoli TaxID=2895522 RepID=UPI001E501F8B|nr:Bax inhibitor-1/YccA family protein [Brevibacillus humidisoli]UFJ40967.1 Bax inhibitor-1/YccA family protein [Brevibacillus humidisoli]
MNYEVTQPYGSVETNFSKLLRMFAVSLLVSAIGCAFGTMFVPPALILPLVIVELLMLVGAFIFRRRGVRVGYLFTFAFVFISGITLGPTLQYYAMRGDAALVNIAFFLTAGIFVGLAAYAYVSKRDFSFLGGMLFAGLIGLILLQVLNLFLPLGSGMQMLMASAGVLIFSGYILYDISNYKHGVAEEDIPLAVISLYLDFINLFLSLLRLLGLFGGNDD